MIQISKSVIASFAVSDSEIQVTDVVNIIVS